MKILAVDLGMVRTGLAISDVTEFLASPIGTVTERHLDRLVERVTAVAAEQHAEMIVVGHPKNMDGTRGESALRAEDFAEQLRASCHLPVTLWDERMTTLTAHSYLNEADVRGKKRKAVVDTVAATVILQDYLEYRRLHKM